MSAALRISPYRVKLRCLIDVFRLDSWTLVKIFRLDIVGQFLRHLPIVLLWFKILFSMSLHCDIFDPFFFFLRHTENVWTCRKHCNIENTNDIHSWQGVCPLIICVCRCIWSFKVVYLVFGKKKKKKKTKVITSRGPMMNLCRITLNENFLLNVSLFEKEFDLVSDPAVIRSLKIS